MGGLTSTGLFPFVMKAILRIWLLFAFVAIPVAADCGLLDGGIFGGADKIAPNQNPNWIPPEQRRREEEYVLVPANSPPDYLSRPSMVHVSRLTKAQRAMYCVGEDRERDGETKNAPPIGKAVQGHSVEAMHYDPTTRKGMVTVRIGNGGYASARKFARQMVEEIVCDHNVALVAGEAPQKALFMIGAERIVDGDKLEMEFEAN